MTSTILSFWRLDIAFYTIRNPEAPKFIAEEFILEEFLVTQNVNKKILGENFKIILRNFLTQLFTE